MKERIEMEQLTLEEIDRHIQEVWHWQYYRYLMNKYVFKIRFIIL